MSFEDIPRYLIVAFFVYFTLFVFVLALAHISEGWKNDKSREFGIGLVLLPFSLLPAAMAFGVLGAW